MRVLITNNEMYDYNGTTSYVGDLAVGLVLAGIEVEVFTLRVGPIGRDLIDQGVQVSSSLKSIKRPDIIHVHHNITALRVLSHFRSVPAVYWIHDRVNNLDIPLRHQSILQYLAVDYNCKQRYTDDHGFEDKDIDVIYNWVDTKRFEQKQEVSLTPKKALVFSNYASETNFLPEIRKACDLAGLQLDVIGGAVGNSISNPENYLGEYDIVFAKAKAAMESMAVGNAVIVCDFRGLAGMVTPEDFSHFRKWNFGMKLMNREITVENLTSEINKYEPSNISKVTELIQKEANFDLILEQLLTLYQKVVKSYAQGQRGKYKFSYKQAVYIRRATFSIWMSHNVYRFSPLLHSGILRFKSILLKKTNRS